MTFINKIKWLFVKPKQPRLSGNALIIQQNTICTYKGFKAKIVGKTNSSLHLHIYNTENKWYSQYVSNDDFNKYIEI